MHHPQGIFPGEGLDPDRILAELRAAQARGGSNDQWAWVQEAFTDPGRLHSKCFQLEQDWQQYEEPRNELGVAAWWESVHGSVAGRSAGEPGGSRRVAGKLWVFPATQSRGSRFFRGNSVQTLLDIWQIVVFLGQNVRGLFIRS